MRTVVDITPDNLSEYTAQWMAKIRAGVRSRPHLQPDPGRCALLVVDMNNYFAHPGGSCFLPAVHAVIPNIQSLMHCFRREKSPVIFTRHGHDGPEDTGMLGRFFTDFIVAGSGDAQIVDALQPRSDEKVFDKKTYDAFLSTGLADHLHSLGVSQVMIAGVLTQMCVETSARSAFCRGFEVYVPADATATTDANVHFHSLTGMASAVAVILSTGEIEKIWDASR